MLKPANPIHMLIGAGVLFGAMSLCIWIVAKDKSFATFGLLTVFTIVMSTIFYTTANYFAYKDATGPSSEFVELIRSGVAVFGIVFLGIVLIASMAFLVVIKSDMLTEALAAAAILAAALIARFPRELKWHKAVRASYDSAKNDPSLKT